MIFISFFFFSGQSEIVVSGVGRTFCIQKSHNTNIHSNPVFLPITMANNVSVLTNQTSALMASKRSGQASIPIRIQNHVSWKIQLKFFFISQITFYCVSPD